MITPQTKPRPYWHVDAKWVCGLLFILFFGSSLILSSFARATDSKHGPELAALAVGSGFVRGNTIDTQDARKALADHGGVITPLPNVPSITITEADLKLTPAQISVKVFQPITTTIYQDGIDAAADKYSPTAESSAKFKKDASLLGLFTEKTHSKLAGFATIFMLIGGVFAAGVIYFSDRWGRLANIGLLLIFTTVAGTALGFALSHTDSRSSSGSVAAAIQNEVGGILTQTYSKFLIFGILLIVAALAGRIFSAVRKTNKVTVNEPA